MRYQWIKLFFILACASSYTVNADTTVGSSTITITGVITPSSCSITTGQNKLSVDFGSVPNNTATAVGKILKTKDFVISLDGCNQGIIGTQILASGTSDLTNPDYLRLSSPTSSSTAQGIAIKLSDAAGKTITIGAFLSDLQPLHPGDGNKITLNLSYIVTSLPVTAGAANAVLYLDMYYQ